MPQCDSGRGGVPCDVVKHLLKKVSHDRGPVRHGGRQFMKKLKDLLVRLFVL